MTPSLRKLDQLLVAVETDERELAAKVVLGDSLADALRHDQVGGEDTLEVRVGGDQVGGDVETGRRLAVGIFVGDELQAGIFRGELLGEALLALLERAGAGRVGDQRHVAFDLAAIGFADGCREAVGGDASALHVVGGQERGEGLGVGAGVDADDLDLGGGFVDRLAQRLEFGRRR